MQLYAYIIEKIHEKGYAFTSKREQLDPTAAKLYKSVECLGVNNRVLVRFSSLLNLDIYFFFAKWLR